MSAILKAMEALRDDYAKKVRAAEAGTRYAHKRLFLARARLEAADEIVRAVRKDLTRPAGGSKPDPANR